MLKVAFRGFLYLIAFALLLIAGWLIFGMFWVYRHDLVRFDLEAIAWCLFALVFGLPALAAGIFIFRRLLR